MELTAPHGTNTIRRGGNWSVEAIQALSAWDYQYFFNRTILPYKINVGIVDAGVQDNHEDLTGKVFFPDAQSIADNDPYDNHGTHVAGIMGAIPNNGKGVTGILWDTVMYSLQLGSCCRYGRAFDAGADQNRAGGGESC
jgi:subtilisin family serine protease